MRRLLLIAAALSLVLALTPAAASADGETDQPFHDSTVLVGMDGTSVAALEALPIVEDVANVLEPIDVAVVTVAPGTVESAVTTLAALPGVAFAEPNYELALFDAPNDPRLGSQYGLVRIDAVEGWAAYHEVVEERFAPSGGATLGVIDSGLDLTHPEFDGLFGDKVVECRTYLTATGTGLPGCQENNVHGTHVSGIATAIADNAEGIAGVGFDADLMALQACTAVCFTADTAAAMIYAADNGADVTNYSFGGPSGGSTAQAAVAHAADAGVLQIAAAGNDGTEDSVNFPAGFSEVVAVSSTNQADQLSSFSSQGAQVDVAAPGSDILSALPGAGLVYGNLSGTSMASPHVAGLGALLVNLGLDADEARAAIVEGADTVDDGDPDKYGAGRINVANSIEIALDDEDDT